ncbi:purine-rich negative regulatory element binding [Porites harrisoni]
MNQTGEVCSTILTPKTKLDGVLLFKAEEINFRKKMRDNEFGTPGQLGKGPLQSCRNSARSEHRYKNMLHLWEFLLELLADESCRSIICWRRREEGEFELLNQQEVAKRWGILKQRGRMDYGKLSRALRLYYRDGIITKVQGQRLVYKFNNLPYTYKPGITRSFYRDRFPTPKSSLGEHEPREYKPLVPQMRISCTTATQPFPCFIPSQGRLSSWPVHPINSPRVCRCGHRLGTSFSSANCSSRSRVFFPFLSFSVSHGFNLHEPALSHDTNPQLVSKKIPVSMIVRPAC